MPFIVAQWLGLWAGGDGMGWFQILQPWHNGPIVPAINKTTVYTAYSLLLTVKAGGFAFPLGGFFELKFSCG
jgi:hypothetical protein